MATVMHIAVVKEADYPALVPLCVRSVVGDDYASFLRNVEERCKQLEAVGGRPLKTEIDPAAFKVWFGRANATAADLSRYAAVVANG